MKTAPFYAIYVKDTRYSGGRLVAYCSTRLIAERELEKYRDEGRTKPPKADDYHIRELSMITE